MPRGVATWASATRIMRLFRMLQESPTGRIRFDVLASRLEVSERTLSRYVKQVLQEIYPEDIDIVEMSDEDGADGVKYVRLRRYSMENRTGFQLAPLYMSRFLLNFLEGTVLDEDLEGAIELFEEHLSAEPGREKRGTIGQKVFALTVGSKSYRDHEGTVERLLQAIIFQNEIAMTYRKAHAEESKEYRLQPLTLLAYKQGLYVIADSDEFRQPRFFAVERIDELKILRDAEFSYPEGYSPASLCSDSFGIFQSDTSSRVIIEFTPQVAEYVTARNWHGNQSIEELPDGGCRLSFESEGMEEVLSWVLSFGAHARVVAPMSLRRQVLAECRKVLETDRTHEG